MWENLANYLFQEAEPFLTTFFWPVHIASTAGAYPPAAEYVSTSYTVLSQKEHSVNPGTEKDAVVFVTMSLFLFCSKCMS